MEQIAANYFFDKQVLPRWPDWKPEDVEVSDWVFWIGKTDKDTALAAIRDQASNSRWKKPTLRQFRTLVQLKAPAKEKVEQSEPTVFVMYEGGGQGSMLAGYNFPIIVWPGANVMKAAEKMRAGHESRVGGVWKIYTDMTGWQMNQMRLKYHERRVNA